MSMMPLKFLKKRKSVRDTCKLYRRKDPFFLRVGGIPTPLPKKTTTHSPRLWLAMAVNRAENGKLPRWTRLQELGNRLGGGGTKPTLAKAWGNYRR